MLRSIALGEQILISFQYILQRRRKGIFRCQTVSCAEYTDSALICQRRTKALGIFQIAAGKTAAMNI